MSRRRRFTRRGFLLGGAAASLALPAFESLAPRRAAAAEAEAPKRFIAYYTPNGMYAPLWDPGPAGPLSLSPTLAGLAGLEDQLLVLSGLDNSASDPGVPGHHAAGTAGFLTAARPRHSESDIQLGPSIDQLYADHIAGETPLHSLQLGLEGGGAGVGHCDNGFACAYSRSISWAGPSSPLSKVVSPRIAFDLLFAGSDPEASASERERRRALRQSAIDSVGADVQELRGRLGSGDQTRLDDYLSSVRALERRLDNAEAVASCSSAGLEGELELAAWREDTDEHARLMAEIMVLALRCDLTRSISFMLGNSASTRAYPQLGISRTHHDLSHHAGEVDKVEELVAIEAWEIDQLAYLLQRLRETPEGEGSLLDSSLVLMSSELSDGNSHSHSQLPVVLAGSGGGLVSGGRHLVYEPGAAYGDLLLSLVQGLGVPVDTVGQGGEAPLPGLQG